MNSKYFKSWKPLNVPWVKFDPIMLKKCFIWTMWYFPNTTLKKKSTIGLKLCDMVMQLLHLESPKFVWICRLRKIYNAFRGSWVGTVGVEVCPTQSTYMTVWRVQGASPPLQVGASSLFLNALELAFWPFGLHFYNIIKLLPPISKLRVAPLY